MDKSIRVKILDREYPLRVNAENEARTREIAEAVDARMQAIRKHIPAEPDLTVAVMAALAYGEELASSSASNESKSSETLTQIDSMLRALTTVVE
ncbi:MAG: cell division protein ZapA [Rhodothermia bacterium]